MPITPFIDSFKFDPETERVMGIAFEMTIHALRLTGRADLVPEIIAKKILELAILGERDPDLICERALIDLRPPPPQEPLLGV
jgi:hypothetical protein